MKIIREACVENQEQLDNAFNHHAEQIELCSRLDVGGFTPTSTLTKYALSKSDHVLMMVRNRPDFNANCWNVWCLRNTILKYRKTNIQGFVFGFLKNNQVNQTITKKIVKAANGKETVFSMAFDEIADWKHAMDTLIKLGVTRILTKGGKSSAINNIEHLKELKTYAADRIQLIVGGSVTDKNYLKIASETGIERFHGRKLAFNN